MIIDVRNIKIITNIAVLVIKIFSKNLEIIETNNSKIEEIFINNPRWSNNFNGLVFFEKIKSKK